MRAAYLVPVLGALALAACTEDNPGAGEQLGPEPVTELAADDPVACDAFFDWDESTCAEGAEYLEVDLSADTTTPRVVRACSRPYVGADGRMYQSARSIPSTTRDPDGALVTYSAAYGEGYIFVSCADDHIVGAVFYTRPQAVDWGSPDPFAPDEGACTLMCEPSACRRSESGADFPLCGSDAVD